MKDTNLNVENIPHHVAIIMDGNGTWAKKRGLPRNLGHRKGAKTLKKIILFSNKIGIKYLTVFAFSTENWSRPQEEVNFLMKLPIEFLNNEKEILKENIKFICIGDKKRLPIDLQKTIDKHEKETTNNSGMNLVVALNYGGKDDIVQAVNHILKDGRLEVNKEIFEKYLYTKNIPDVDLLIRTSGQQRISNFLLWELSYSELYFTNILWPDFNEKQLLKAIDSFNNRVRRYGGIK